MTNYVGLFLFPAFLYFVVRFGKGEREIFWAFFIYLIVVKVGPRGPDEEHVNWVLGFMFMHR